MKWSSFKDVDFFEDNNQLMVWCFKYNSLKQKCNSQICMQSITSSNKNLINTFTKPAVIQSNNHIPGTLQ